MKLTARARAHLEMQHKVARRIERQLRREVGDASFDALASLLGALGGDDQPRMRDYLRQAWQRE